MGKNKCHIVDTFWQTETGGHVMLPLANVTPTKPGSCSFPFFGIEVMGGARPGELGCGVLLVVPYLILSFIPWWRAAVGIDDQVRTLSRHETVEL